MGEEKTKIIEKHYIEIPPSAKRKFFNGLLGGLGTGIGLTLGTSIFLVVIGFLVSKIDFVPIFGQFLADVIKAAQPSLRLR